MLLPSSMIDCHVRVFDPARFPYPDDAFYRPAGGEIATAEQLGHMLDAHGVAQALIVAPNSGYYGPLLALVASLLPHDQARQAVLRDTPRRLFGFD